MLRINDLELTIDNKQIFKDVNFEVNQGEFVALIGPNGSGKSSIIKVISRLANTFTGKVSVLGKEFTDYKIKDYSKILSTMAQHQATTQDLSVFDRVAYGRFPHLGLFSSLNKNDIAIIEQAIKDCELEHLRDSKLTNLSGGELQRVFLAACLAQEPELLILDEPTNHLDVLHQYKLLSLVRNQSINKNLTVLCVLHDINQAIKFSDRLCIMKDGQLLHNGQAKDIITEETILDVFGIQSKIYHEQEGIHVDFIYN